MISNGKARQKLKEFWAGREGVKEIVHAKNFGQGGRRCQRNCSRHAWHTHLQVNLSARLAKCFLKCQMTEHILRKTIPRFVMVTMVRSDALRWRNSWCKVEDPQIQRTVTWKESTIQTPKEGIHDTNDADRNAVKRYSFIGNTSLNGIAPRRTSRKEKHSFYLRKNKIEDSKRFANVMKTQFRAITKDRTKKYTARQR